MPALFDSMGPIGWIFKKQHAILDDWQMLNAGGSIAIATQRISPLACKGRVETWRSNMSNVLVRISEKSCQKLLVQSLEFQEKSLKKI